MNKRTGLIALVLAGVLAVGLCYGFLGIKTDKASVNGKKGSGMAFPVMMTQLSQNLSLWEQLSRDEQKRAVDAVVSLYKNRDNIAILNTDVFYVGKIEETLRANPSVVSMDIMTMVRILSVMEYDFYNGENKDDLARKILGEKGFVENQKRRQESARFANPQQ